MTPLRLVGLVEKEDGACGWLWTWDSERPPQGAAAEPRIRAGRSVLSRGRHARLPSPRPLLPGSQSRAALGPQDPGASSRRSNPVSAPVLSVGPCRGSGTSRTRIVCVEIGQESAPALTETDPPQGPSWSVWPLKSPREVLPSSPSPTWRRGGPQNRQCPEQADPQRRNVDWRPPGPGSGGVGRGCPCVQALGAMETWIL